MDKKKLDDIITSLKIAWVWLDCRRDDKDIQLAQDKIDEVIKKLEE